MTNNNMLLGRKRFKPARGFVLTLLLAVGLTACDNAVDTASVDDSGEMVEMLTSELSRPRSKVPTLPATAARPGGRGIWPTACNRFWATTRKPSSSN